MPGKWVDIDVSGENMEAYVAEPEAEGTYPAVIVIQEVWGANSLGGALGAFDLGLREGLRCPWVVPGPLGPWDFGGRFFPSALMRSSFCLS